MNKLVADMTPEQHEYRKAKNRASTAKWLANMSHEQKEAKRKSARDFQKANPARNALYAKRYRARIIKNLEDSYIKLKLNISGYKSSEITQKMINEKRLSISLYRINKLIKEMT